LPLKGPISSSGGGKERERMMSLRKELPSHIVDNQVESEVSRECGKRGGQLSRGEKVEMERPLSPAKKKVPIVG